MSSGKRTRHQRIGGSSLANRDMSFLLQEEVDRSLYDTAKNSVEPLKEIAASASKFGMTETAKALNAAAGNVASALADDPKALEKILGAMGLSKKQGSLVDAITAAEVLKFSILNSMDATRLLILKEFKTEALKFYTDEALEFRVVKVAAGQLPYVRDAASVPFAKIDELGELDIYFQGPDFMWVGKASDNEPKDVYVNIPGFGWSPIPNVSADRIYLVGRTNEGDPSPAPPGAKSLFRRISGVPDRGSLDKTVDSITGYDKSIAEKNFRIPPPAEGAVVGIYRAIRKRSSITPPALSAGDFVNEMEKLTLEQFKELFKVVVENTTGSSGDVVSYDAADSLFFAGLSAISGVLGTTKPQGPGGGKAPPPPPTGAAPAQGSAGGSAAGGGGGGGAPARQPVQHSLRNILSRPSIVAGSTAAEREANLRSINQDALRRELNSLTAGSVIFTEGTVDRWCKLAGIKESK